MANIFLRSPHYVSEEITGLSAELVLSVNGDVVYTILKNKQSDNDFILWEVSEITRDYLDLKVAFVLNPISHNVDIDITTSQFTGLNGSGTKTTLNTYADFGIDAYSYFEQGYNTTTTKGYMQSNDTIYKYSGQDLRIPLDRNNVTNIVFNFEGSVELQSTITPSAVEVFQYIATDVDCDEIVMATTDGMKIVKVITIEECKFKPHKLLFVNKWGAIQDLWFFKKSIETIKAKRESFKRFNIDNENGYYNPLEHQNKTFNAQSTKEITLNTGYVDEQYNSLMQEVLQSEQVWLEVDSVITPMTVQDNSLLFKTSLNDRLVDYTLKLSYAYNTINNVR